MQPDLCRVKGNCLCSNVNYKAEVTTTDNNVTQSYIGANTIIATIDVKSLYTNIPHGEGINDVLEALDNKHGRMWPLRKVIHQYLEYILKENYFIFNDKLFLQKHGTTMGTKMAPSFANIFMGALEQTLLSSSPDHLIPLLWKRFIDDIFLIWTHGEASFQSFIQHLNSFHPTIKFCLHYILKHTRNHTIHQTH